MLDLRTDRNPQTLFLPPEILRTVVSFLEPKNIAGLLTVNRDFYQHISANEFWKRLCPGSSEEIVPEGFYLARYRFYNFASNARKGELKITKKLYGHMGQVRCVKINQKAIISGADDQTIRIWDLLACLHAKSYGVSFYSVSKNSLENNFAIRAGIEILNDNLIAAINGKTVSILDCVTGLEVQSLVGHSKEVTCLAVKEKTIVSGAKDGTIRIWNQEYALQRTLQGHTGDVTFLQLLNQKIISGSDDCTICIWDQNQDAPIKILREHKEIITGLKVTNDLIVSSSNDRSICIWDASTYALKSTLLGHEKVITSFEIIGDTIFSCSTDLTMRIWDLSHGTLLQSFELNTVVNCMTFFGNTLFTGNKNHDIQLWGKG